MTLNDLIEQLVKTRDAGPTVTGDSEVVTLEPGRRFSAGLLVTRVREVAFYPVVENDQGNYAHDYRATPSYKVVIETE